MSKSKQVKKPRVLKYVGSKVIDITDETSAPAEAADAKPAKKKAPKKTPKD